LPPSTAKPVIIPRLSISEMSNKLENRGDHERLKLLSADARMNKGY